LKAANSAVFVHLRNFGQLDPLAVAQAKGGSGGTRVKTLFTQIACTRSVIWAVAAAAGIKSRPVLLRTWVQSRGY
jgi:hypothetical protein